MKLVRVTLSGTTSRDGDGGHTYWSSSDPSKLDAHIKEMRRETNGASITLRKIFVGKGGRQVIREKTIR